MLDNSLLSESLEILYGIAEKAMQTGDFLHATDTAIKIIQYDDWQGANILKRVKKIQASRGIPTTYVDSLIKQNKKFVDRASLYHNYTGLLDIFSLQDAFNEPELIDAMYKADYSHPNNAFENVLGVARKLGLTERRREFLHEYGVRLGLNKFGLLDTILQFYGIK